MSGKRSKKTPQSSNALAVSRTQLVPTQPPPQQQQVAEALITVSGILDDGRHVAQDLLIKYNANREIGEAVWGAIETIKHLGGLVEDVNDGVNFYPLFIFNGGLRIAPKKMLGADTTKM